MVHERRSPTWQWIAVTTIGVLTTVAAYAYVDTQAKIEKLVVMKADKETVDRIYEDVRDIKALLTSHVIETGVGRVRKPASVEGE